MTRICPSTQLFLYFSWSMSVYDHSHFLHFREKNSIFQKFTIDTNFLLLLLQDTLNRTSFYVCFCRVFYSPFLNFVWQYTINVIYSLPYNHRLPSETIDFPRIIFDILLTIFSPYQLSGCHHYFIWIFYMN